MADNSTTIAQLEEILNAGVLEGQVDGQRVKFNSSAEIRKRIRELQANDDTQRGRRPVSSTINLGGF